MQKRFLSLLCVLALCLGLLPVTALAAAPQTLYVGDCQITNGSAITYLKAGSTAGSLVAGSENDWTVKYEPSTATLTLNGATIQGGTSTGTVPYGAGIYAQCSSNQSVALTIELIGKNTITGYYGIFLDAQQGGTVGTNASLLIRNSSDSSDNGRLEVSGSSSYGIYVKSGTGNASLTISDASVVASSSSSYSGYAGVCVQSGSDATSSPQLSLTVNGGSLTTSASEGNDGIQFYVGALEATSATTSLTVTDNAIVDARTGGISASGVSGNPNVTIGSTGSTGGIVFDGTKGTVYGDVTLQEDLEIGEGETLTIPEGASLTVPDGKTLTNNGTVTIENGGTLTDADKVTNSGTINVEDGGNLEGTPTGGTVVKAPTITTESPLPEGTVGTEYSQTLAAENNPTSWSVTIGTLPAGLTLDTNTGTISGIPTAEGSSAFTVTAENSAGSATQEYTLTIKSVPVASVSLNESNLSLYTGKTATLTATVQPSNATNQNVTWSSDKPEVATVENGTVTAKAAGTATITVTTEDGNKTATCAVTVEKPYTPPPYIPPSKPNWTSVARKLANAQPGDTVTVKMNGETEVPGEVWETIAGRDVTVILDMGGNVSWTVDGKDIPADAALTDIDMGVSLNTSDIPVDVINLVTGEKGTVQLTLAHDGEFGFTMTLTAPLGVENKGLWANLYHYNTTLKQMLFETAAQVDSSGNVALKFTHASEYAIVLDEKSHELPFTDTVEGAWYQGAVEYVYRNSIMTGTSATTFEPNAPLSRAMVAQILYNLEGQPAVTEATTFTDSGTHWAAKAIAWAQETGVVSGYEDNTFRPNKAVTREELAQMLYNYAKYKDYDLTTSGDLTAFPDGEEVSSWAETAMAWANGNELINGHDDGTLEPGGDSTRAQAASILMNFDVKLVQ